MNQMYQPAMNPMQMGMNNGMGGMDMTQNNQMNQMNQMGQSGMNPMQMQMYQGMNPMQMQMQMMTGMGMNPQMMMNNMQTNNMSQQAMENMQNNNANISNNSGSTNNSSSNSEGISVIFRVSGSGGQNTQNSAPIMVQCMPNEKVSEVIKKYRTKSGDNDTTKKFIFNAKNLSPSLTVAEAGITNNANIFVVATKGIKGAQ